MIRVWRLLECVGGDWVMAGGCKTQMVSIKGLSLNDKLGPLPGARLQLLEELLHHYNEMSQVHA